MQVVLGFKSLSLRTVTAPEAICRCSDPSRQKSVKRLIKKDRPVQGLSFYFLRCHLRETIIISQRRCDSEGISFCHARSVVGVAIAPFHPWPFVGVFLKSQTGLCHASDSLDMSSSVLHRPPQYADLLPGWFHPK